MLNFNYKKIIRTSVIIVGIIVLSACGKKRYDQAIPIPTLTEVPQSTMIPMYTAVPIKEELPTPIVEEIKAPTSTPTPSPIPTVFSLPTGSESLEQFLRNAIKPLGTTLYIWGGGWNEEDTGAGDEARTLGLSEEWREFFDSQTKTYDYNSYLYKIHKGLDCSGFVGWAVYNTLEKENGKEGYVVNAVNMAESLAERGLGTLAPRESKLLPGDIVSMSGHVYISLGTCEDGSVLVLHSSPPGVRISGTEAKDSNNSQAIQMAYEFTKEYYPEWFERYNKPENYKVSSSYLENIKIFRWSEKVFKDAENVTKLSPAEILAMLAGLSDEVDGIKLQNDAEYKMYLNVGEDKTCESLLQVEHMLRYNESAEDEPVPGYEYLEFGCRLVISDEAALNEGYSYQPFIADKRNLSGNNPKDEYFSYTFNHIKSGVYEEQGKTNICDTFICKMLIPENSENYVFGFINTASHMSPDYKPTGDNHLILFNLDATEALTIKKTSDRLTVGDFVSFGIENEEGIWYVMAEDEQGYKLLSKNLLSLDGKEKREALLRDEIYLPEREEIISCLWKNGLGYDTIIAAEPTKNCYEEIVQFWGTELPEDLVFYNFALKDEDEYCGIDGIGNAKNGGSLMALIGLRPCYYLKNKVH